MAASGRFRAGEIVWLLIVLAVAAGARAWFLSACAGNGTTTGPVQVQDPRRDDLDLVVLSLHENRGYAARQAVGGAVQRAQPAPLYPWLLSQLLHAGAGLPALHQHARWLQALLGTLTAGLLFLFARQAFGSTAVAAVAGLLAALHPFWILNTAEIDDGVLATFLLAACLFLGERSRAERALTSWLFGLALAALALTRAALLPFAFLALLWHLRRCQFRPQGAVAACLAVLGFVSALSPWLVRNYLVFHDVFPIVDSTYFHLWVGNHAGANGGPAAPLTPEERRLSDRERAHLVFTEVSANPAGTLERRLRAGLYFFLGEDWFQKGTLCRGGDPEDWLDASPWLSRTHAMLLSASLLGSLTLGVLGWRWSYRRRGQAVLAALAFVWLPLPYVLGHAEALQGPRLPLDAVLLCYAAYALVCMATTAREYRVSTRKV